MPKPYPPTSVRLRALAASGVVRRDPSLLPAVAGVVAAVWVAARWDGHLDRWRALAMSGLAGTPSAELLPRLLAWGTTLVVELVACSLLATGLGLAVGALGSAGTWAPAWRRTWRPVWPSLRVDRWTGATVGAGGLALVALAVAVLGAVRATAVDAAVCAGSALCAASASAWGGGAVPLLAVAAGAVGALALVRWWVSRGRFDDEHGLTRAELVEELRREAVDARVGQALRENGARDAGAGAG